MLLYDMVISYQLRNTKGVVLYFLESKPMIEGLTAFLKILVIGCLHHVTSLRDDEED